MAWTSQDIEAVRAAVLALASGARTASVSYGSPPRTVSYVPAQLGELRSLLASMEASSSAASARPRHFRRAGFSKGLGNG